MEYKVIYKNGDEDLVSSIFDVEDLIMEKEKEIVLIVGINVEALN